MLWRLFNSGKGVEKYKHGDKPAWVLVTGSSDGIGKGLAKVFLARGFNVFVHGRNAEKLAKVKDELTETFPDRSVEVIVADAADVTPIQLNDIVQQIGDRNLTVLVNNAAWIGGKWDSLQDSDYETVEYAINVNVRFFTHLTRVLLPVLHEHQPALIINISSLSASMPMGYLSVYSASKAYMVGLSRALVHELAADSRIEVMVPEIHNAQSSNNKSDESWSTPSTMSMATSIVNSVGKAGNNVVLTPYWGHEVMGGVLSLLGTYRVGKIGTDHVLSHYKK